MMRRHAAAQDPEPRQQEPTRQRLRSWRGLVIVDRDHPLLLNRNDDAKVTVALFMLLLLVFIAIQDESDPTFKTMLSAASKKKKKPMKKPPLIAEYKLNCSSAANLPPGWCADERSQKPRYVGISKKQQAQQGGNETTIIRHYTHAGYEHCLAGKSIMFIGDSRVRYQFMHLTSFLLSKQFMKCEDYYSYNHIVDQPPDSDCFLINERHYAQNLDTNGWISWFKESDQALASHNATATINDKQQHKEENAEQQFSLCDCYRFEPFSPNNAYENRFIKRFTKSGAEINVMYMQNFENKLQLNDQYPPFAPYFVDDSSSRCATGKCDKSHRNTAFQGDLIQTLQVLPQLNVTHAFVNLGWETHFRLPKQLEFACTVSQEYDNNDNQSNSMDVYLLSHPITHGRRAQFDANAVRQNCPNAKLVDRNIISRGTPKYWYWDNLHAFSILNEAFNHQLVETICPIAME